MSTHYLFPQPGGISGIPGSFAGVRVDVADDGSYTTSPLVQYPHLPKVTDAPTADDTASEATTEAVTPESIEEA